MEAVSLAGVIVQFAQLSIEFTARVREIHRSANGTVEEAAQQEAYTCNLLQRLTELQDLPRDSKHSHEFIEKYQSTARDLLAIFDSVKVNGPGVRARIMAALRGLIKRRKIDEMTGRLDYLVQGIQVDMGVEQTKALHQQVASIEEMKMLLTGFLETHQSRCQKDLGSPWETGTPVDHIRIDDGLGAEYFLPMDFCSDKNAFLGILLHKFKSNQLPGLSQVQNAQLEIWNWNQTVKLDPDNWASHVKAGHGLKVSFVMCVFLGFDYMRCLRCLEPQKNSMYRRQYTHCSNCRLEIRWVEPSDIPYLPKDAMIGWNHHTHGNNEQTGPSATQTEAPVRNNQSQKPKARSEPQEILSIDLVCHRLTMKWEPMANITHRYIHCRCILRQSTPSRHEKEMTLYIITPCPRHNTEGIAYMDYGEQNYHKDPYFNRFGGYNAFRALIWAYYPPIFDVLGGNRFLPEEEFDEAMDHLQAVKERLGDGFNNLIIQYVLDIFKTLDEIGIPLPEHATKALNKQKDEDADRDIWNAVAISHETKSIESPIARQVGEILDGRWSGRPHWAINN